MSIEEFTERAKQIYDIYEGRAGESGHIDRDHLMVECLTSLGYKEGIDILLSMEDIWYA